MEVHRPVHGRTRQQLQLCSGDLRQKVGRVEVSAFFSSFFSGLNMAVAAAAAAAMAVAAVG
jgi:hypothetical protein